MDQGDVRKIIRIAKKLFPKVLRWWKKRQSQQQQQGGSGGGGGGTYASHSTSVPGAWAGSYGPGQQFPQGQFGPPSYPIEHAYSPGSQGPNSGTAWPSTGPPHQQPPYHHQQGPDAGGHGHRPNQDMINASNPQYTAVRNAAIREGDLMHQCFDAASKAHNAGDGARAKQLSNEGHQHQAEQRRLNDQASQMIFAMNNSSSAPGEVDLHGLYVQEAIDRVEQAVQEGQRAGRPQLIVITGKGLHSTGHVARIKPAIEQLMVKYQLRAHVDPHNAGRLIVDLQAGHAGASRDVGFVDRLDEQAGDGNCTIM